MSERRPRRAESRARRAKRRGRLRLLAVLAGAAILVVVVFALARSGSHHRVRRRRAGDGRADEAGGAPGALPAVGADLGRVGRRPLRRAADPRRPRLHRKLGHRRLPARPLERRLRPAGSLSGPLHDAAATVLGNRVLVFGGGAETSTDEVQALPLRGGGVAANADRRSRGQAADGPLRPQRGDGRRARLRAGRLRRHGAARLGARHRRRQPLRRSHEPAAARPLPRRGGARRPHLRLRRRDRERRGKRRDPGSRPKAGTARVVGHLPRPLSHASAIVARRRIYVLGGEAGGAPSDRIWRFDPALGPRDRGGAAAPAVAGGAAAGVGSTAYLIGGTGAGGAALDSVVEISLKQVKPPSAQPAEGGGKTATPRQAPAAALPRQPDDRRPRQRPHPRRQRPQEGPLALPLQGPSRRRRGASTSPTTPSSPTTAPRSSPTRSRTSASSSSPTPPASCSGPTATPGVAGSEPGYLHEPDDAYLWRDGTISVADAQNCRVLLISQAKKVLKEFGSPSSCAHEPPQPARLAQRRHAAARRQPARLRGQRLLHRRNHPRRQARLERAAADLLPVGPAAARPRPLPGRRLRDPGGIYKFNRAGKILWSYRPASGPGMLDHPSLAERLPGGLIAVNDDYRHRLAIIDPKTAGSSGSTATPATRAAPRPPQHPRRLRPARPERDDPDPPLHGLS